MFTMTLESAYSTFRSINVGLVYNIHSDELSTIILTLVINFDINMSELILLITNGCLL